MNVLNDCSTLGHKFQGKINNWRKANWHLCHEIEQKNQKIFLLEQKLKNKECQISKILKFVQTQYESIKNIEILSLSSIEKRLKGINDLTKIYFIKIIHQKETIKNIQENLEIKTEEYISEKIKLQIKNNLFEKISNEKIIYHIKLNLLKNKINESGKNYMNCYWEKRFDNVNEKLKIIHNLLRNQNEKTEKDSKNINLEKVQKGNVTLSQKLANLEFEFLSMNLK